MPNNKRTMTGHIYKYFNAPVKKWGQMFSIYFYWCYSPASTGRRHFNILTEPLNAAIFWLCCQLGTNSKIILKDVENMRVSWQSVKNIIRLDWRTYQVHVTNLNS